MKTPSSHSSYSSSFSAAPAWTAPMDKGISRPRRAGSPVFWPEILPQPKAGAHLKPRTLFAYQQAALDWTDFCEGWIFGLLGVCGFLAIAFAFLWK